MIKFVATALALVVAAADNVPAPATSPGNVPEPAGIYQGPMHGYTPSTLKGGTVIDAAALAALIKEKNPLLVDVAEVDHKPAGLPATTPWRPRHHAIPGSVWLPGAGHGALTAPAQSEFDKRLAALTNGDKGRAIVTYCHPDCWGSWNAGKRLILSGYRNVFWMPSGIEGWQEEHPTAVVQPDTAWSLVQPSAGDCEAMTISRRSVLAGLTAAMLAAKTASALAGEAGAFSAEAFAAAQRAGKPILVDVAAPWCPICKRQQPLLAAILSDPRYKDVQRFNIDFDTQKDALRLVGARTQSTLICYKGTNEVGRSVGQTQREWLEDQLENLL